MLTFLGNDDAHILEPRLDDLQAQGLCVNLNGRVHREEGLVFCGMNKVRDYPFGYKHWCARDGSYVACPQQFFEQGLEIDEHGNFVPLDNLVAYLSAKPSIGGELNRLVEQLQPGEMARSVWMLHQAPSASHVARACFGQVRGCSLASCLELPYELKSSLASLASDVGTSMRNETSAPAREKWGEVFKSTGCRPAPRKAEINMSASTAVRAVLTTEKAGVVIIQKYECRLQVAERPWASGKFLFRPVAKLVMAGE